MEVRGLVVLVRGVVGFDVFTVFDGVGFWVVFLGDGFVADLGFAVDDFRVVVGVLVFGVEVVAFLERREVSPSIDLFLSIVYNYSIWRLS